MTEFVTVKQIGEMAVGGDVAALTEAFSLGDWDTRETVIVAFDKMLAAKGTAARIGEHGDDPEVRRQARSALHDIVSLCRAERSGGSYRDNCIRTGERLLEGLDVEQPGNGDVVGASASERPALEKKEGLAILEVGASRKGCREAPAIGCPTSASVAARLESSRSA
ncbi:MAG: hypothetical protein WC971_03470 [Coriobacteriia bacterium]